MYVYMYTHLEKWIETSPAVDTSKENLLMHKIGEAHPEMAKIHVM